MSNKIALFLFTTTVLLASFAFMAIPQANALTQADTTLLLRTARLGNSVVCGDHKCAPGEHNQWVNAVMDSQKTSYGKIGSTYLGEDVMNNLAASSPGGIPSNSNAPTGGNAPMGGNMSMTDKVHMSGNVTGNMPGMPTQGTK